MTQVIAELGILIGILSGRKSLVKMASRIQSSGKSRKEHKTPASDARNERMPQ